MADPKQKVLEMPELPKVSVLIPTYNYAHYLDEAIESILQQTYQNFEVIIVDDNSTDDTDATVKKYLADSRFLYYKNTVNIGLAENFNMCLQYASGKYIKYLLADDKFHPLLLDTYVNVMEANKNISLITSSRQIFGIKNCIKQPPLLYLQSGKKVITETLKDGQGNWIGEPSAVMFRKADLRVGGFNTQFTCFVDWDMWLRLLTVGDCYILPEVLSYFRVHEKQASKVLARDHRYTFEDYMFYKCIWQKNVYNIELSKIDIETIVKKKAAYCAKAMYRALFAFYKKNNYSIFWAGFKIALKERVFFKPLISFYNNI